MVSHRLTSLLIFTLLFSSYLGCGSSGSSSSSSGAQATTISGNIQAPNGALAKLEPKEKKKFGTFFAWLFPSDAHAQVGLTPLGPGLSYVTGGKIFIFRTNSLGCPILPVVAEGVITNSPNPGDFSINLPAGTALTTDLVIQIAQPSAAGPVCINSPNVINCPTIQQRLVLNPAAQLATLRLLQASGAGLSSFTPAQAGAFIALVQTRTVQVPFGGGTLQDAVDAITTNLGLQITQVLNDIQGGGGSDQSLVAGAYHVMGFGADTDLFSITREVDVGTITFNSTNGTFSFTHGFIGNNLSENCQPGQTCQRTFVLSPRSDPETITGSYFRTARRVYFTTDDQGQSVVGYINSTGTIATIPNFDHSGSFNRHELWIALRKGSGVTTQTGEGTFNVRLFQSALRSAGTVSGSWAGPLQSGVSVFRVGVTGTTLTPTVGDPGFTGIGQNLTCLAGPPCTFNSTLPTFGVGTLPPVGTITTQQDGMSLLVNSGGQFSGGLSADGNLRLLTGRLNTAPNTTLMSIGVRQPPSPIAMTDLNGTFEGTLFCDAFETNGAYHAVLETADVVFNNGAVTVTPEAGLQVTRSPLCTPGTSGACATLTTTESLPPDSWTVSTLNGLGNGSFLASSANIGTVRGALSPGNDFFVAAFHKDTTPAKRGIVIGTRIQ